MNYSKLFKLPATMLLMIAMLFTACDESDDPKAEEEEETVVAETTVENLAADPTANEDGSERTATNKFTLFSFKDNAIIANEDSLSGNWDIGFRGTSIIVNGGETGPGSAAVQIVTDIFEELTEAPADGYVQTISGSDWYTYTGAAESGPQHAILVQAGKIFVIKTADGHYAKMEILSYYYGNPDTSTEEFADLTTRPASRYYTFRFLYQPDDSTSLAPAE